MKRIILLVLTAIMLLAACAPAVIEQETGTGENAPEVIVYRAPT